MDIFHYYDLQRWKFLSSVRIKILFFHKFLAALEVQFHTRLLLMMKYNEFRSFGESVLGILKLWFCDSEIIDCICMYSV